MTRRDWCLTTSFLLTTAVPATQAAAAAVVASQQSLLDELKECKIKLEPIPEFLEQKEWDKVRSILKVPPVNKLWNLGDVSWNAESAAVEVVKRNG